MRGSGVLLIVVCLLIEFAEAAGVGELETKRAAEAHRYMVRVNAANRNIFTGRGGQGHGTGFIVRLEKERALVFTNLHVVEADYFDAQNIMIDIPIEGELTHESVKGEVVFRSRVHDFAIVEFDPRELQRTADQLRAAKLATEAEIAKFVRPGRFVMTAGYPGDSERIFTFGQVTGVAQEVWGAKSFIQVQAPINFGNSGGPLIDLETGKVVGINTAIEVNANNVGFCLPITLAKAEWNEYLRDIYKEGSGYIYLRLLPIDRAALEGMGYRRALESIIPNYFDAFDGALVVRDVDLKSGLEPGDIVVAAEETLIGDRYDNLVRLIENHRTSQLKVIVLRGQELLTVEVGLKDTVRDYVRRENNFVMVSGYVLQDLMAEERPRVLPQREGAIVREIAPGTLASEAPRIPVGTVIIELRTLTRSFPIRHLGDLRRAMRNIRKDEVVFVRGLPPLQTKNGIVDFAGDAVFAPEVAMTTIAIDEVITSRNLSLEKLRRSFEFSGSRSNHWRKKLNNPCVSILGQAFR